MINESIVHDAIKLCNKVFYNTYNAYIDVESCIIESAAYALQKFDETKNCSFKNFLYTICKNKIKTKLAERYNCEKRNKEYTAGLSELAESNAYYYESDPVEYDELIRIITVTVRNKKLIPVLLKIETLDECSIRTGLKRNSIKVMVHKERLRLQEAIYGTEQTAR